MLSKILSLIKKKKVRKRVIPASGHVITREKISNNAWKVLLRLQNAGYSAYLVGGGIRDLLLELEPKDFDIATDATPDQIRELFYNCRLIGRRFRLAHIHFGREIIEVATFRAGHGMVTSQHGHGMIVQDNVYGKIDEDVLRRDFTVNALYYNVADFSLVDFVGGVRDLSKRRLRLIGDPVTRYKEDPVRMLRAIRFAAKLDFKIESGTAKPIKKVAGLLKNVPAARLFEEYNKLFLSGQAVKTYHLLREYRLLEYMFPGIITSVWLQQLIDLALYNTDLRVQTGQSVAPAFLFAVLYWGIMLQRFQELSQTGVPEFVAYQQAIDHTLRTRQQVIAMPRRFLGMIDEMWQIQLRFVRCSTAQHVDKLYELQRFRAGYDLLLLRSTAGDQNIVEIARWWQAYVEGTDQDRIEMKKKLHVRRNTQRRRRPKKQGVQHDS